MSEEFFKNDGFKDFNEGPMIERGTKKIDAQPHIKPTYNQNIEKYQKIILQELGF